MPERSSSSRAFSHGLLHLFESASSLGLLCPVRERLEQSLLVLNVPSQLETVVDVRRQVTALLSPVVPPLLKKSTEECCSKQNPHLLLLYSNALNVSALISDILFSIILIFVCSPFSPIQCLLLHPLFRLSCLTRRGMEVTIVSVSILMLLDSCC